MRRAKLVALWLAAAALAPVSGLAAQAVANSNGAATVSGTVAVSSLPALPTGGNTIGAVTISGAATANQGTAAAVSSAWPVELASAGAALATNNDRLIAVSDGINQGGGTTDMRIDGWGDGTATSYGAVLAAAQLSVYNGGSFDRLRSTSADGSSKTGVLEANPVANYIYISGASTTVARSSGGVLHKIVVNTPAAGTIALYDVASGGCSGTPGSGKFASITLSSSSQPETLSYDVKAANGICVVTSAAMDITAVVE